MLKIPLLNVAEKKPQKNPSTNKHKDKYSKK